ncbi:hypothetical protein ACFE04_015854 [Oxalis oulophora]
MDQEQQYPLDSDSYKLLSVIGKGANATVYKAVCELMNSSIVAIKSIDLDKSRANLDDIRRETKMMSLLSHPNILKAHCAFTVDHRLWVVMPFMSGGSLQSIISSRFPNGVPEPCIAVVLREILNALFYLHHQGHLHRDIKAGNILVDQNGNVKLADFGISASLYEWAQSVSSSSSMMLTDFAGTPYWMAPEVIHSHVGYSFKADIWSFGITALELAYGKPPLSHLPASQFLLMKLTKCHRLWDYEKIHGQKKKLSKAFKDMIGSCLDQDPLKRPSADKLLKHAFFRNSNKGSNFVVRTILQGLPTVEVRFKETETPDNSFEDDYDSDSESMKNIRKERRISGWNFNDEALILDPIFPMQDTLAKPLHFAEESLILDKGIDQSSSESSPMSEGVVDRELMLQRLVFLRKSLDDQRTSVNNLIGLFGGDHDPQAMNKEETERLDVVLKIDSVMQQNETLMAAVEDLKSKNFVLEIELELLKVQISDSTTTADCKL